MVRTKIICTLGPASGSETIIRKMILAGMDVARLNLSHGSIPSRKEKIGIVRRINHRYRRAIKILLDLEGLRIRTGILKEHKPIELRRRKIFYLQQGKIIGEGNLASFNYEGSISDIKKGQHIFIDDGNICLRVLAVRAKTVKTEVVVAGLLKENKGINIPEAHLKFFGLSRKDREGIHFGIKERVDYIAQSFVRNKKDILNVANIVKKKLPECKIIAKIENREGIRNIEEIIDHCDGIMIARGDMGVSLPVYEIPILQKQIIKKCNQRKKMVITATQMLESMVNNPRPTRAEVTDVANAILDGTDFVMLSEETAAGKFPVEAVTMMNQIIKFTEGSAIYRQKK